MRNFVEIPGGKSKRFSNRKDGTNVRHEDNDEGFFKGDRQQDARRQRRESRQLMRRVCSGEHFSSDD